MNASGKFHIMIDAQPQEHLLSVLGRFGVLSGYGPFWKSAAKISSDTTRLCPAAFNRRVYQDLFNALPERNNDGTIARHTPFNYYKSFYPGEVFNSPHQAAVNGPVFPIGHDTFKYAREWRWCSDCVESDIEITGFPYFRIEHQLPGIILCPHHRKTLRSRCGQCKSEWKTISKILVPPANNECPKCKSTVNTIEEELDDEVMWLHEVSWDLLSGKVRLPSLSKIQERYRSYVDIPLSKERFSIRQQKRLGEVQGAINEYFSETFYQYLLKKPGNFYGGRRALSFRFIGMAFSSDKFFQPVFHLMLIRALFKDIDSFIGAGNEHSRG